MGLAAALPLRADLDRPDVDVPANSPAFGSLRRIQTRSALLFPAQAFPQRGQGLGRYLVGKTLSSADSVDLSLSLPGHRRELVRWADSVRGHSLFVSPSVEAGWHGASHPDSNDGSMLAGVGGTIYGSLAERLSFYTHALVYSEFADEPRFSNQFSPRFGETYAVEKGAGDSLLDTRTFNRFECYVLAELPWVTLKAGRDRVHMGPGYFSSLIATRDTPPYYLIEARIDFASWLTLDNYLLRMTDTEYEIQKYANLHRFEFKPTPRLSLAFQDIVIYQDRDPDSRYLLPLVPLTFTESDIGGPDNAAMGFDFMYTGLRNVSVWGELFIDDLMGPAAFFDDFWENRWSGLAGLQLTSPLPAVDADLVVEYGHVEPWTYSGRKPQTSFRQFNVPSASMLGPDSRTWDMQASYRPWKWMELMERIRLYDKGLGRAGTLGTIHDEVLDGTSKSWLGGEVRAQRIMEQTLRLKHGQYLSGSITWAVDFGDAPGHRFGSDLRAAW